MLSNASRIFQTSDKLKENFTCGICGENYTNDKLAPITLHCGHTFCRNCIDQLGKDKSKHVPCGVCFTNTWTPAKKLTKNYQMLDILGKYELLNDEPISTTGLDEATDLKELNLEAVNKKDRRENKNEESSITSESSNALENGVGMIANDDESSENTQPDDATESLETIAADHEDMEIDEGTEHILTLIREATEVIRSGLDELDRFASDVPVNKIIELQRHIGLLFNEIDEVAYHPLITLVRRTIQLHSGNNGQARLQDLIHQVDLTTTSRNTRVVTLTTENDVNMARARMRILLEAENFVNDEMAVQMLRENSQDDAGGEAENGSADNYSLDGNSENLTSGRDIGSSLAGSDLDHRDAVSVGAIENEEDAEFMVEFESDGNMMD